MITQFSQVNKKTTRLSSCCFSPLYNDEINNLLVCAKCHDKYCETITFYEYLEEKLANILLGEKVPLDIFRADTRELLVPAYKKITKTLIRKIAANYQQADCDPSPVRNKLREIICISVYKFSK